MKKFQTTRKVNHSATDMFALVADIERYPEFLPLCKGLTMRSREQVEDMEILTADMTVAYKFFSETFTSKVTLNRHAHTILVEYLDGPFTHLENRWEFIETDERKCDVNFYIAYELRSTPLQMLMGGMFDQAFGKFSEAFEERADIIYGVQSPTTQPAQ